MNVLKIFTLCFLILLLFMGKPVGSQQGESDDKTLSPYFFVLSEEPDVDQLPLKSTSAVVNISGVIADIKVTQVYKNEGDRPLEAIYVFPASTRAAVYGMKMTIGERIITAQIRKREEARQEYEQAKQQGKSASLLEQQRPNVFQMNVAHILPGDVIKVELSYTELMVPTAGVYEFIYPTVVGPRYSNQPAETSPPAERWIQNPYLHQGEPPHYTFDITVHLNTGVPVKEVSCTSHKVAVNYDNPSIATVRLDQSESYGGNRDYILEYRLDGRQIESGLLLYEGEKEKFFLLMMQPPEKVTTTQIPKREYIFIVDVSGSMHGFPLDISKTLLKDLISSIRPSDTFNILLFAGGSTVLSEKSLPASPENISKAITLIERQQGGGGTELLPALKRALALPKSKGCARTVVIATDGYVTVEEEAFDLIRKNLGNANMFPFGIGSSVNRHIIEGMAHAGMGEPFVITKKEEASDRAEKFRIMIQSPVLTNITIDFGNFSVYDVEPLSIPDVLAERPVIVFGKWRDRPQGTITLHGVSGNNPYTETIDAGRIKPAKDNSALRYLWARHRITLLSDYNKLRPDDERIREVTNLGLAYNLLTAYTSFIAVDTEVRNRNRQVTTVKQPLPLPQGVSDYAVGGVAKESLAAAPSLMRKQAVKDEEKAAEGSDKADSKGKRELKIGEILVSGGLSKTAILKMLEQHIHEIESCLVKSNKKGKFVIKLILHPNGTVKRVNVIVNETQNTDARQCIIRQIRKWEFPVSSTGHETEVTIHFVQGT